MSSIKSKTTSDCHQPGNWLTVAGAVWQERRTTFFNFEVEEFHTYFVGAAAALVHNTCRCGPPDPNATFRGEASEQAKFNTSKITRDRKYVTYTAEDLDNPIPGSTYTGRTSGPANMSAQDLLDARAAVITAT